MFSVKKKNNSVPRMCLRCTDITTDKKTSISVGNLHAAMSKLF